MDPKVLQIIVGIVHVITPMPPIHFEPAALHDVPDQPHAGAGEVLRLGRGYLCLPAAAIIREWRQPEIVSSGR